MARKPIPQPSQPPVELVVSREDATAKIQVRVELGRDLLKRQISSWEQLESSRKDYYTWSDYNKELLKRLFTDGSLSQEYEGFFFGIISSTSTFADEIKEFTDQVGNKIHSLESIMERLEHIPTSTKVEVSSPVVGTAKLSGKKIFVVHGHDEGARESTARFLEKLGFNPIILHEQANSSRSLIEKLEKYSDVDFAVVLLTPDDVGTVATAKNKLQPRARQNVVLELGYFMGKLGRDRVCALHKERVELPSDFLGIAYIQMDEARAWHVLLARELREAGFEVDLNTAL